MSVDFNGHNLIFIVGSPRSGTTWLQKLLASHPKIHTGQESGLFDAYIGPQLRVWYRDLDTTTSGRSGIGLGCYLTEEEFMQILKGYLHQLMQPMLKDVGEGEIFLEKTPSHALFLPEIMELLPNSRIIFVLRDGRDAVASLLAASKSWGSYWAPKNARAAAVMWRQHVEAVRKIVPDLPQGQFMEVKYESLVQSPNATLRSVFDFLGLDCSEKEIENSIQLNQIGNEGTPIQLSGEVKKSAGSILREPEGFVRKGQAGNWADNLSWLERLMVWVTIRKTMGDVGYPWCFPWMK